MRSYTDNLLITGELIQITIMQYRTLMLRGKLQMSKYIILYTFGLI